jgi:uncharacterized protein DUF6886
VSEDPGLDVFKPQTHPTWPDEGPMIWAIGQSRLMNYLLPRDCPRVTYYALPRSTHHDVAIYLDGDRTKSVVIVEEKWLEAIRNVKLWLYEFDPEGFSSFDPGAGYYVARTDQKPKATTEINGVLEKIKAKGTDFRTLPTLWSTCDEVVASSLQFSMIRMRNAIPRNEENG